MERLICAGCGRPFEQARRVTEPHGEVRWASPCCGESALRAEECQSCGGLAPADDLHHGLCRKCRRTAVEEFRWLLKRAFTQAQREVINEAFDGVSLA